MKPWRLVVCLVLILAFSIGFTLPAAQAAKRTKAKTEYSVVIDRLAGLTYVFSRKTNSTNWDLVGAQICSVGNPFAETPKGTFVVTTKKKTFTYAGKKYKYVVFTNCRKVAIMTEPKRNKKDQFYQALGEPCTMGEVWLAQKWAKWIYRKIPVGTKVYIF